MGNQQHHNSNTSFSLSPWKLAASLTLGVVGSSIVALPIYAEGSRDLVENGGHRPYTEYQTRDTGPFPRRTVLQVYAEAGETINVGSSAVGISSTNPDIVSGGQGDAYIFDIGTIDTSNPSNLDSIDLNDAIVQCTVDQPGTGLLNTRAQELAGPAPNTGGYTPCTFTVPAGGSGIYQVIFTGPDGENGLEDVEGSPSNASSSISTPLITGEQNAMVSLWDITVRTSGGTDLEGRVFTDYLSLLMGSNSRNLNSEVFIVTTDGYQYRTDFNGLDPNGFIYLANSKGNLTATGEGLYNTAIAEPVNDNTLNSFAENATTQAPEYPIFFNLPDNDTLTAIGLPTAAIAPQPAKNFLFTGGTGGSGNQTIEDIGGNFSFDAPQAGSFQIIIDTNDATGNVTPNGDGIFSLADGDRLLIGDVTSGFNVVPWDGRSENNQVVPGIGEYDARIILYGGEYHFPLLDVETATNGFTIEMLNPPGPFSTGATTTTFYYDERDYDSDGDGNFVDVRCETPSPGSETNNDTGLSAPCDARDGIDSATGAHRFSTNYGDKKVIDTWIYFPSAILETPLVITETDQANIRGTKSVAFVTDTDGNGSVTIGDVVEYTITYTNLGATSNAIDFEISDTLPSQLTFLPGSAAITANPSNRFSLNSSFDGTSTNPQLVSTNATGLLIDETITVTFRAVISNDNSGTPIPNQAIATFDTSDNGLGTSGSSVTDADSNGGTSQAPSLGNSFSQIADDSAENGNDPTNTADDDPTLITVVASPLDYGDAPDGDNGVGAGNYQTTLANGGPRHAINTNLRLGVNGPDADDGTLQNATATADDLSDTDGDATPNEDDEDGVTLPTLPLDATDYTATINVTNNIGRDAYLVGWIDFDQSGTFETNEGQILDFDNDGSNGLTPIPTGTSGADVTLNWTGLSGSFTTADQIFARFRITDSALTDANGTRSLGLLGVGEVEDYQLSIGGEPELLLVKRITAVRRNGVILSAGDRPGGDDTNIFNDLGTDTNDNNANWPTDDDTYLPGALDAGIIQAGDEVEYTIFFLNAGGAVANNVQICDVLPTGMTYVTSSMELFLDQTGTVEADLDDPTSPDTGNLISATTTSPNSLTDSSDGDRGTFFAPGANPIPSNLCVRGVTPITSGADNTTGAVVYSVVDSTDPATTPDQIDFATAPGTPPSSYGFIRFRATLDD